MTKNPWSEQDYATSCLATKVHMTANQLEFTRYGCEKKRVTLSLVATFRSSS